MRNLVLTMLTMLTSSLLVLAVACGDANDQKIGGQCTHSAACENEELTCLTQFKGGYCGASGCSATSDCPSKRVRRTRAMRRTNSRRRSSLLARARR